MLEMSARLPSLYSSAGSGLTSSSNLSPSSERRTIVNLSVILVLIISGYIYACQQAVKKFASFGRFLRVNWQSFGVLASPSVEVVEKSNERIVVKFNNIPR